MANRHSKTRARSPAPNTPTTMRPPDDRWVDVVADHVSEVLTEEALELELVVFYDKVTETLHAVGYDGAPARYFRGIEVAPATSDSPRSRGIPMWHNHTNQPARGSPETNEQLGA